MIHIRIVHHGGEWTTEDAHFDTSRMTEKKTLIGLSSRFQWTNGFLSFNLVQFMILTSCIIHSSIRFPLDWKKKTSRNFVIRCIYICKKCLIRAIYAILERIIRPQFNYFTSCSERFGRECVSNKESATCVIR